MKKTLILLLFILTLSSFQGFHKFYLSVTEIEYNEENSSLEIISKVFIDDLEKLLKTRYSEELFLSRKEEHPGADAFLEKYLKERVAVEVDGTPKEFNYLGKEYENDLLILYIEIKNIAPFDAISVRNEVLTGLFPDQKNVVHVEYRGENKSLLLSRNKERGSIDFSD